MAVSKKLQEILDNMSEATVGMKPLNLTLKVSQYLGEFDNSGVAIP